MYKPHLSTSNSRKKLTPRRLPPLATKAEAQKKESVLVPSVVFSFQSESSHLFEPNSSPLFDYGFPAPFLPQPNTLPVTPTCPLQIAFPVELVQHIFRYLPLEEFFNMRSLCRHIQNCLLDPHFALVVLKREIELEGCEFEARVDIGTLTDQDSLTEMDLVWFKMPEPYASIYARLQFLSLRSVYLTNSSIDGRLPPTISELPLHTLVINSSELKGRLPVSLGRLRFLKRLSLANNLVKGNIPKEISNLGLLKVLDLSGNRLTGSIPDLYNLQSLQTLNFSSNSLSGQIPSSLGSLENLITLNLSNNNLTGTIPDLTILPRLDILDLSENRLMSPIPDLPYTLQEVQLNNNSFTGPIPVHLTRLSKLRTLSLSHNHFTLTIPAGFGKMPRLLNLNLSHNKLIGSIPPFDESCFLTDLDLSSNNLSTGIVPDMDLLTSLETITVTLTHADKGDNDGIFVSHLTPCEECDCVGGCLRQRQRMNLEQRKWEFNICYRQEFVSMILNDVRPSSFRSSLSELRSKWLKKGFMDSGSDEDTGEGKLHTIRNYKKPVISAWGALVVSSSMLWMMVFGGWTWALLSVIVQF